MPTNRTKCRTKILEAHANVKDLNLIESKMNFIKVSVFASCVVGVDIVESDDLYFSPLL